MKLLLTGFFDEFDYEVKMSESVLECIDILKKSDVDRIYDYLTKGIPFVYSPGISFDVISKNIKPVTGKGILTDGVWAWPEELSYYVLKYRVKIDENFYKHMKKNNWVINNISEDILCELEL